MRKNVIRTEFNCFRVCAGQRKAPTNVVSRTVSDAAKNTNELVTYQGVQTAYLRKQWQLLL